MGRNKMWTAVSVILTVDGDDLTTVKNRIYLT